MAEKKEGKSSGWFSGLSKAVSSAEIARSLITGQPSSNVDQLAEHHQSQMESRTEQASSAAAQQATQPAEQVQESRK